MATLTKRIGILILIIASIACKKEDKVKPLVALKGDDTVRVILNSNFTDPGVTATDETDGDLSQNVAANSDLDINKVGYYEILYSVSDEAGNVSQTVSRIVKVYNEAENFVGRWFGVDTTLYSNKSMADTFELFINIDSTWNKSIIFSSLSSDRTANIYCDVNNTNLDIPQQETKYNDSLEITCQGLGEIRDSIMRINYSYYTDTTAQFKYVKIFH